MQGCAVHVKAMCFFKSTMWPLVQVGQLETAKMRAQRTAKEKMRIADSLETECKSLKGRLKAVMHDQRKLVVQLGLTQQKAGIRGVIGGPEEAALMAAFQSSQGVFAEPIRVVNLQE